MEQLEKKKKKKKLVPLLLFLQQRPMPKTNTIFFFLFFTKMKRGCAENAGEPNTSLQPAAAALQLPPRKQQVLLSRSGAGSKDG